MLTRRDFIKGLAVLGGFILTPLHRLVQWRIQQPVQPPPPEGELYAGFLLLPDGAPRPTWIEEPPLGIPVVCGVGAGRGGPRPTVRVEWLADPLEAAQRVTFPLYYLAQLPESTRSGQAYLVRHATGEEFVACLTYDTPSRTGGNWEPSIRIAAQPDFPRPYPLWASLPVGSDGPAVVLEKVDFLPTPGVMVATVEGAVFHWISEGVLYTLYLEGEEMHARRSDVAASLVRIP